MNDGKSGDEFEKRDAVAGQNERCVMRERFILTFCTGPTTECTWEDYGNQYEVARFDNGEHVAYVGLVRQAIATYGIDNLIMDEVATTALKAEMDYHRRIHKNHWGHYDGALTALET